MKGVKKYVFTLLILSSVCSMTIYLFSIPVKNEQMKTFINTTSETSLRPTLKLFSNTVNSNSSIPRTFKPTKKRLSLPVQPKVDFAWISQHPIYKRFYIDPPVKKKSVNILIIVSSAPKRFKRRYMIRSTWWSQCVQTGQVKPECIFITDFQGPNDQHFHEVQAEKLQYKDLYFQLVESGVTFGKRFMYHMLFAEVMYDYDYFLRIDDDQFLCLERLLQELPYPLEKQFHWGWVHHDERVRRPEESIILFSRDVIHTFLLQKPNEIVCHPWADQMIASWMKNLRITTLLRHDNRILHSPSFRDLPYLKDTMNICRNFIALHGVYDDYMKLLWKNRGKSMQNVTKTLKDNSQLIYITRWFNWQAFYDTWRYEPKLCITNPSWDTSKQMGSEGKAYAGRE